MVSNAFLAIASLFWGVNNQGDSQRISIDHYTSGYVLGVKGEDIHLPPSTSNTSQVMVAVLDTGADSTHPELKKVLIKGYNFVNNNEDTTDTHGHGTHLSGIIALQATQHASILPIKVVQTGPNAPIRPQDVQPGAGTALTENVAKGINYAIEKGAKVINLSLAWPVSIHSKKVDEAMALAAEKDVLVISSAGNDGTQANVYPCVYSNVICVGAHGPDGAMTYFTNYGSMVDILAPGITILSTWPMNKAPVTFAGQVGYEFRNGTSMAAPYVAGAAAELLSRGYSASETRARLLLGTRNTATQSQYSTKVVGDFSIDSKREKKFSRFGNLDVSGSIAVTPQSLILPIRKAAQAVSWNGTDTSTTVTVQWKNTWKSAQDVKIIVAGQNFSLGGLAEGGVAQTQVVLDLSKNTEALFSLPTQVESTELSGEKKIRSFPLTFSVSRKISTTIFPKNASLYSFATTNPRSFSTIRTVVNSDQSLDQEFALIRKNDMVLTRNGIELGKATFTNVPEDKILNIYRLNPDRYALFSMMPISKGEPRPSVLVKFLDSKLQLLSEIKVGTEATVLPENFIWKKTKTDLTPFWISIGVTPTIDKPAYDPWNKKPTDPMVPRMYYLEGKELHTIKLADDELPLFFLPNGDVLIAKGSGYFIQYEMLKIDLSQDSKIVSRSPYPLDTYRMLLGLDSGNKAYSLKASVPDSILLVGASTPGNLRTTTIAPGGSTLKDTILKREGTLDSLISILGAYHDLDQQYFFSQTHYDLKFYHSASNETHSLSLNRYSYIPSMIFARSFYPLVLKDSAGNGSPAVYMPAGLANANISEVVIANTQTGAISKPARLRFEASDECLPLANLIPASETSPAKQVFICDTSVITVPLTSAE